MHKFLTVVLLCVLIAAQKTEWDSPENLHIYRNFRKWILYNFGGDQLQRPTRYRLEHLQKQLPPDVPFPCNVAGGRSAKVPDSVHRLRPGDIDVVAAMGDSITAGNGIFAMNLMQVLIENRGAAASIGGQGNWRTYLTLPNILKEFNPNLIGYSLGDTYTSNPDSQFNVAEFAAMAKDMPFMARYLVDRMKQDPRVNIKKHWKLISILIGHNDLCNEIR
ncbi:phospholipase B1, membrane-associated-like isoform X2 [Megachile rotundata]|uniref:phospholipase B1, membrane-associated-like isoform X2 n=1 Tax=Megachile rotundata TaxID=143995 RepID=UPI003FD1E52C